MVGGRSRAAVPIGALVLLLATMAAAQSSPESLRRHSRFAASLAASVLSAEPDAAPVPQTPSQGRLVFTQTKPGSSKGNGAVRVVWRSDTAPLAGSAARVTYGTKPGVLRSLSDATAAADAECGSALESSEGGAVFTAELHGLLPGNTYYYRYGQEGAFSAEASFTTPPASGKAAAVAATDDDSSIRLLVAAGMGVAGNAGVTVQQGSAEATLRQAALLATGQLTPAPAVTRAMMQQLLDAQEHHGMLLLDGTAGAGQMETLLTRVPLAAVPSEGRATSPRGPDSSSTTSKCAAQWYSFNTGPVHVVMLDTAQSLKQNSAQFSFLQSDLCAVNRSVTPWVVVAAQHGMYVDTPPSASASSDAVLAASLSGDIEQLLVDSGVDLVLSGQGRMFTQSCPAVRGGCVDYGVDGSALGPVHVNVGSGGAAIPLRGAAVAPAWMVAESFEHSFGQLSANAASLSLQVLASRTGAVLSTLTLTQPPTKAAVQRSMLARRAAAKLQLQGPSTSVQDTLAADLDGLPDMAGLDKLLQADLPASVAAAPPAVMAKLAGPGSMLANTLAGVSEGDAPTPETTWLVTMQLMQAALDLMAPVPPTAPKLQLQEPTSSPAPQQLPAGDQAPAPEQRPLDGQPLPEPAVPLPAQEPTAGQEPQQVPTQEPAAQEQPKEQQQQTPAATAPTPGEQQQRELMPQEPQAGEQPMQQQPQPMPAPQEPLVGGQEQTSAPQEPAAGGQQHSEEQPAPQEPQSKEQQHTPSDQQQTQAPALQEPKPEQQQSLPQEPETAQQQPAQQQPLPAPQEPKPEQQEQQQPTPQEPQADKQEPTKLPAPQEPQAGGERQQKPTGPIALPPQAPVPQEQMPAAQQPLPQKEQQQSQPSMPNTPAAEKLVQQEQPAEQQQPQPSAPVRAPAPEKPVQQEQPKQPQQPRIPSTPAPENPVQQEQPAEQQQPTAPVRAPAPEKPQEQPAAQEPGQQPSAPIRAPAPEKPQEQPAAQEPGQQPSAPIRAPAPEKPVQQEQPKQPQQPSIPSTPAAEKPAEQQPQKKKRRQQPRQDASIAPPAPPALQNNIVGDNNFVVVVMDPSNKPTQQQPQWPPPPPPQQQRQQTVPPRHEAPAPQEATADNPGEQAWASEPEQAATRRPVRSTRQAPRRRGAPPPLNAKLSFGATSGPSPASDGMQQWAAQRRAQRDPQRRGISDRIARAEASTPEQLAEAFEATMWAQQARQRATSAVSIAAVGAAPQQQVVPREPARQPELPLPAEPLVMSTADGTPVPASTLQAFAYTWHLLQGRLRLGDNVLVRQHSLAWPGGWVVDEAPVGVRPA